MTEYTEHWMTTHTGKKFHYRAPSLDEISIWDIAHHLSLICRFVGAVSQFYSVAEHSIRVAALVPQEHKLAALLHDAAEAYIGDISRPVKSTYKLKEVEDVILKAISKKFRVDFSSPYIREADDILLATEARDLMPYTDGWAKLPTPLINRIIPISPKEAELSFLQVYADYSMIRSRSNG